MKKTSIVLVAAALVLAACEEPVSPPLTIQPSPTDDYEGHYLGIGTSTRVSLSLGTNSFDATVLALRPQAVSSFRTSEGRQATSTSPWMRLRGDVGVSGDMVKATITGATSGRQDVSASAYSGCLLEAPVTAPSELLNDMLDCLGLDSVATTLKTEKSPSDMLVGTWLFEETSATDSTSMYSSHHLRIEPTSGMWTTSVEWCGGGPYPPEPDPMTGPGPKLSVSGDLVMEGDTAVFTVTLSPPTDRSVTVDWSTTDQRVFPITLGDGTPWESDAVEGIDYTLASGTLTFQPGQASQTFTVATLDDSAVEGEEIFRVVLSNPDSAAIVGPGAIGTIIDLDDWPCIVVEGDLSLEIEDTYIDVDVESLVFVGPDGERIESPSTVQSARLPYVIDRSGRRLTITDVVTDPENAHYLRFIKG